MHQDLNAKHKTIKLEDDTGENLDDLGYGNGCRFRYNTKGMIHERNIR